MNKDQVKTQVIGEIEGILEGLQKRVLADRLKIQAVLARLPDDKVEQQRDIRIVNTFSPEIAPKHFGESAQAEAHDSEKPVKGALSPDQLDSIARKIIETNSKLISSLIRGQVL